MLYALCAGFFVLGLVTRDLLKAIWSSQTVKRMNRRMKRGGVNYPGRSQIRVTRHAPVAPQPPAPPSSRAVGLFGPAETVTTETPDRSAPFGH